MLYFLLFCLFGAVRSFEPSCITCKFFIPNSLNPDFGLCRMFEDKIYDKSNEHSINNFASYCRNNENLCGKSGTLYSPINKKYHYYEYMNDLCNGEFTDVKDLEELERLEKELVDTFQKMRKHNTNTIYKTSKKIINKFIGKGKFE
jgi:hypothetical protein